MINISNLCHLVDCLCAPFPVIADQGIFMDSSHISFLPSELLNNKKHLYVLSQCWILENE